MAGHANSRKAVIYALGANFSIFVAKSVAAFVTGSGAMMAEAIHSLADCGNQVLLLLGMRQAERPPTPEHPLGWGKAVYFWSFLVAILLFSIGGMFSLYEGIHKLQHPEPMKMAWVAVLVLVFGIVVEAISFRACVVEVNKVRRGRTFLVWFRESRNSELIVIFGEDLAALLGLIFALIAVVATWVTGNPLFDALGTLGIGVLLIGVAIMVAREVKELLIGESVDQELEREMQDFIRGRDEVDELLNVITLQLGKDVMLAAKARMAPQESNRAMVEAINRVEKAIHGKFPQVRWTFFEPDVAD